MEEAETFIWPPNWDETILCAKLQWLVNNLLVPDCGEAVQGMDVFSTLGVYHLASERHGLVMWSVFENNRSRFIVFRGYAMGTLLPLPFPVFPSMPKTRRVMVNAIPYYAWKHCRTVIESYISSVKETVVSGYSIGTASAMLTAAHFPVTRIHLFSPFPFCEAKFFDNISVPFVQVWLFGDRLTSCYNPFFVISRVNQMTLRSLKQFSTVFGYHSTHSIVLTLTGEDIAQKFIV